jgi:FAD/FMN-containing dehydrogenase
MKRRSLIRLAATLPLLPAAARCTAVMADRVRPADPGWPSEAEWQRLGRAVGGRLFRSRSPLAACGEDGAACRETVANLRNPYFLGGNPALTQTSGWLDAWQSTPSAYAVAAHNVADIAAAVDFAREHRVRLVVKGGGHSYQGTSNAPDSLLVWPRAIDEIVLHDAFVAQGCAGSVAPQPAVTVGAGATWLRVYDRVTTRAGLYVQGGGCATVGVAGLVQSGGFGSFSKHYGMAAAGLLEAEIVTADGRVRIANPCSHPDLFWGLKGGGGGSLGVVTRLTLRLRELPQWFGGAMLTVRARSDAAFRRLIGRFLAFYAERLFSPDWGEIAAFLPDRTLSVRMVWQRLDPQRAQEVWQPFVAALAAMPQDFAIEAPLRVIGVPARHWWDAAYLTRHLPETIVADPRPGAPAGNVWWAGNSGEAGWFVRGYQSVWLPAALLAPEQRQQLADALFAATRYWGVALHFNKGLAGAPAEALADAADTATNPAARTAFALAIVAGGGPPAFPGLPRAPDLAAARHDAAAIGRAMGELRRLVPQAGSYLSESDYFEHGWQQAFWGGNYPRLRAVKAKYDPEGLFFVHHGVGSEDWSADGFTRRRGS